MTDAHQQSPVPQPAIESLGALWPQIASRIASEDERNRRRAALDRFLEGGLPSGREEDWKYTRLSALGKERFDFADVVDSGTLSSARIDDLDAIHVRVHNGQLIDAVSDLGELPEGVTVVQEPVDRTTAGAEGALSALHQALATQGIAIRIDDERTLARPLHLAITSDGAGRLIPLHVEISLGRKSEATLIEHYQGDDEGARWTHVETHCSVGPEARLERILFQQEGQQTYHIARNEMSIAADAEIALRHADIGGRLVRRDTRVNLDGEGAMVDLEGIYCPIERQHVDNHTTVEHKAPNAKSREHFRGYAMDRGRAVFNGRIVVHPGADGTDSEQASHSLLLSDRAEIDTKPELEIYAEDVRCAHGATVGQLDDRALFYLRSRGIEEPAARALLIFGFVDVLIDHISPAALRDAIETALLARLPGGARVRELASG